jgi:Domain of unknown function (DUF4383)
MSATDRPTTRGAMTWPQLVGLAVGAVFTIIGVVGFFITGFDDFAGTDPGESLLGFMINPLHNVVHLLLGLAGLALARTLGGARRYGWLLAVGYGAAFVYGLFAVGQSWDFLNLNWADNWLHLVTALIGLAIALGPVPGAVGTHGRDASLGTHR